jgi:hypothetical protein
MVYAEELLNSIFIGADYMAAMVRSSLFEDKQLPPPEFMAWYAENVVLRCVAERYKAIYEPDKADAEITKTTEMELVGVKAVLAKLKMFTLQAKIEEIERVSQLHMPGSF